MVFWLAKHWLGLFNVLMGLYVGGTFLAPVLMWLDYNSAGEILYRIYMPFCHQYPFRSWFLFGPQATYPAQQILQAQDMARLYHQVIGSPTIGYKVALCQRDVAIYGSMVLGGVAFALLRKRFKMPSLPLWAYFVFGVTPMLIDGGWQWLGYAVRWIFAPEWWTPHETTAFWRTLTGALFGLGLVALGYPSMHEYFEETRELVGKRYGWQ